MTKKPFYAIKTSEKLKHLGEKSDYMVFDYNAKLKAKYTGSISSVKRAVKKRFDREVK
jgi:hypothetical protein